MNRLDGFVLIYRAANALEAHVIRGLLGQHNIQVHLFGEGLSSGFGELPAEVIEVEIHVPTGYRQLAGQLISEYEAQSSAVDDPASEWTCRGCGEKNPLTLGVCWNCQQSGGN
ncbi:MAG TPA: DUF2007 domain-containing protein [Gammaproteobacteria bacterium]|jgi:hypothetical protein|nr:hypothetical protein [Chromatiales bacterium]HJP37577.1 DUF2007 domain-containing protein [Gammaproteobacteria bacterium]